jgi:hypothetical protein
MLYVFWNLWVAFGHHCSFSDGQCEDNSVDVQGWHHSCASLIASDLLQPEHMSTQRALCLRAPPPSAANRREDHRSLSVSPLGNISSSGVLSLECLTELCMSPGDFSFPVWWEQVLRRGWLCVVQTPAECGHTQDRHLQGVLGTDNCWVHVQQWPKMLPVL